MPFSSSSLAITRRVCVNRVSPESHRGWTSAWAAKQGRRRAYNQTRHFQKAAQLLNHSMNDSLNHDMAFPSVGPPGVGERSHVAVTQAPWEHNRPGLALQIVPCPGVPRESCKMGRDSPRGSSIWHRLQDVFLGSPLEKLLVGAAEGPSRRKQAHKKKKAFLDSTARCWLSLRPPQSWIGTDLPLFF